MPTLAAVVEERECTPTASPRVRAIEGDALTDYLQLRIHGKGAIPRPAHPNDLSGSSQIKRLIGDVVFEVLKTVPPRLLFTHTGMLYDSFTDLTFREKIQLSSSIAALDMPEGRSYSHSSIDSFSVCHIAPSVGEIRTTSA